MATAEAVMLSRKPRLISRSLIGFTFVPYDLTSVMNNKAPVPRKEERRGDFLLAVHIVYGATLGEGNRKTRGQQQK